MGPRIRARVEKVNGKSLTYAQFVKRYLVKNQPVVLTGLMDEWRACADWVSCNGQPNFCFFAKHFGKSVVPVSDCGWREFNDQKRLEMLVSEWIDDFNTMIGHSSREECNGKFLLYLKDWHFVREYPEYLPYETPVFFSDDWLNLYMDNYQIPVDPNACQKNNDINCSDYRFVYMGAKGTWTPLHADVFRSYSWSANVCGKKQWHFLSPSQSHLVFDRNMKTCVYDIFEDVKEATFPCFEEAVWLECIQEANELIFVPSGWYHQVHNLEYTISINHNWFNSCNLSWVWDLLVRDYLEAKEYIEDIRDISDDFEALCQRNLAANTGMNFFDFFVFLVRFGFANLAHIYILCRMRENAADECLPLAEHFARNLCSIRRIAIKMRNFECLSVKCGFLLELKKTLDDTRFIKLCVSLGETYGVIYGKRDIYSEIHKILDCIVSDCDFVRNLRSQIQSPGDLVNFIDDGLAEIGLLNGLNVCEIEEES